MKFMKTKNEKVSEPFNNFFHCDGYLYNYFKLFINLQDVNDNNGPLNYFSIKDNNYFLKKQITNQGLIIKKLHLKKD